MTPNTLRRRALALVALALPWSALAQDGKPIEWGGGHAATLSGPGPGEAGSLLELGFGGRQRVTLPNGEQRRFLEDGDALLLAGHGERAGARRIGFGPCGGSVLPARPVPQPAR